jgi:hypothetical protein
MKMRSGYHLFSVEWNQKEIVWKIDEIIYKTESLDKHFNRPETEENFSENGKPFDNDFIFYIQNVGLNSSELNISEAYVLIDFVKVYERVTNLDCGLPALPPQVVIKGYKSLTPPKKYKNGQTVNFDCYYSSTVNDAVYKSGYESGRVISQLVNFVDVLIGSKFSVCTNGKWNKKSGVCGN